MLEKRFAVGTALGLMVLGLFACGDEKKRSPRTLADGGGAATADDGDELGGDEPGDGLRELDGGAGAEAADGGGADGATLDASVVRCDVVHAQLGCGVSRGEWVQFDGGVAIDKRTGFGWVAVQLGKDASGKDETDDALELKCKALVVPGMPGFRIPEMKDVRTLAAGCAKTLPTGPCTVMAGKLPASAASECTCAGGPARGPHASGGFCRPELAECETIWTATYCGSHSEGCVADADHKHWFYDVSTGAIVVSGYESEIAKRAKARCVSTQQIDLP